MDCVNFCDVIVMLVFMAVMHVGGMGREEVGGVNRGCLGDVDWGSVENVNGGRVGDVDRGVRMGEGRRRLLRSRLLLKGGFQVVWFEGV